MKDLTALFILLLPCLSCVLLAGFLASRGINGWGWFLVVAALLMVTCAKIDDHKAQAGEAGTAETHGGSVHEHAVAEGDAP